MCRFLLCILIILLFWLTTDSGFATKSEKPEVKLFVMSHCPFGLQMIKAFLPVWEHLDDNISVTFYFCDYIMHGPEEMQEQLRQVCLQQQDKKKFRHYLDCFSVSGDAEFCLKKLKINKQALNQCVSQTDKKYLISAYFQDQKKWKDGYPGFPVYQQEVARYKISGSPTLIINNKEEDPDRTPQAILATICRYFKHKPALCAKKLDSFFPVPGFGTEKLKHNKGHKCGP